MPDDSPRDHAVIPKASLDTLTAWSELVDRDRYWFEPSYPYTLKDLDFTYLSENQRPILECIPDFIGTNAPGWRIQMGEGNTPGETWTLFLPESARTNGEYMFITNSWSPTKVSEQSAINVAYVNGTEFNAPSDNGPGSPDNWVIAVNWSSERLKAAKIATQWMIDNCW
jgi:hypothetical protein